MVNEFANTSILRKWDGGGELPPFELNDYFFKLAPIGALLNGKNKTYNLYKDRVQVKTIFKFQVNNLSF